MLIKLPCEALGTQRVSMLDGLKGVALVMVVLYHTGGVLGWNNPLHGEVGVDIFLLITSFLLVVRGSQLSVREFVRRRFFRIFPTYWVALMLFLLLGLRYFDAHYSFENILLHAVGLHGFGPQEYFLAINDSFWFISMLVFTYGSFLIMRQWLHDGGLLLLVGAIATTVLMLLFARIQSNGFTLLANRVPTVFLGFVAGAMVTGQGCEFKLDWKLAAMPLTLSALLWGRGYLVYYPLTALGMVALYASFHRAAASFLPLRCLRAVLVFLGTYSYEIYLLHQPIIRDYNRLALCHWLQREPNPTELGLGIVGGLVIVIPASVLLHEGMKRLGGWGKLDRVCRAAGVAASGIIAKVIPWHKLGSLREALADSDGRLRKRR